MDSIRKNHYSKKTSMIRVGKKAKHSSDIITAVGILGECTTREMAKVVLSQSKDNPYRPQVRDRESSLLERTYRERILGEKERMRGGRISRRQTTGLLERDYLTLYDIAKNEKGNKAKKYHLTFRGCFFVLGNDMTDKELTLFLENASKSYLFFKYILKILRSTSLKLVKTVFINPIKKLIVKEKINLDEDFELSFALIADMIGNSVDEHGDVFFDEYKDMMNNNWYDGSGDLDWLDNMILLYCIDGRDYELFRKHADMKKDPMLLFKVMRMVHIGFYSFLGTPVPVKHEQKLLDVKSKIFPYPKNKKLISAKQLLKYRERRKKFKSFSLTTD